LFVNLLHYPLSPLNACGDQSISSRTSLRTSEQVICRLHMQARENRSHYSDDTLPAFIHDGTDDTLFRLLYAIRILC
jgi:hypothetical protein